MPDTELPGRLARLAGLVEIGVRLSAWICGFSSTHSTSAFSGVHMQARLEFERPSEPGDHGLVQAR